MKPKSPRHDYDPLNQAEASVHNLLFCKGVGLLEASIEGKIKDESWRPPCQALLEGAQQVARCGVAPALALSLLDDDNPIDGPDHRIYRPDLFKICWIRRRRPKK